MNNDLYGKTVMMTSQEEYDRIINIPRLSTFDKSKYRILNHSGYYDGPLNGLMLCNDEICYYSVLDDFPIVKKTYPTREREQKLINLINEKY